MFRLLLSHPHALGLLGVEKWRGVGDNLLGTLERQG